MHVTTAKALLTLRAKLCSVLRAYCATTVSPSRVLRVRIVAGISFSESGKSPLWSIFVKFVTFVAMLMRV